MKKTWKAMKIESVKNTWSGVYKDFTGYDDDRKVFRNTYDMIMEALESLPDEPVSLVRVAMWRQIKREEETMNRIYNAFCDEM